MTTGHAMACPAGCGAFSLSSTPETDHAIRRMAESVILLIFNPSYYSTPQSIRQRELRMTELLLILMKYFKTIQRKCFVSDLIRRMGISIFCQTAVCLKQITPAFHIRMTFLFYFYLRIILVSFKTNF
jgi:hypothetical protein